ncbi:DUF2914 domain-containing protein [Candidatus Parcubacteria bacterium]|nr:DUF2914 domain-containing protein [Candidatus Parcubacteria bacterium]
MKTFVKLQYKKVLALYKKYERVLVPAFILGGFVFEYLKFTHIPIVVTFVMLFGYWFLAGAVIIFMQAYDAKLVSEKFNYLRLFSPLIIQFSFGALLGASLIFYWLAGAFSISWPVMIVVVLLMVFNETFRHWFEKPLVQIGVYFFATISLFSEVLPYMFGSLSPWVFVGAVGASLVVFAGYIYLLTYFSKTLAHQKRLFFIIIVVIAAVMTVLYFTNIIPPIPLSLQEAGVYENIKVKNGTYSLLGEHENFIKVALFGQTLHLNPRDRAILYTAILGPDNLKTTIVHRWQYYDAAAKDWINKGDLSFSINGGREAGYKGYTWQTNLAEGKWRVFVQSERGQVLAKVSFRVVRPTTSTTQLEETVR